MHLPIRQGDHRGDLARGFLRQGFAQRSKQRGALFFAILYRNFTHLGAELALKRLL